MFQQISAIFFQHSVVMLHFYRRNNFFAYICKVYSINVLKIVFLYYQPQGNSQVYYFTFIQKKTYCFLQCSCFSARIHSTMYTLIWSCFVFFFLAISQELQWTKCRTKRLLEIHRLCKISTLHSILTDTVRDDWAGLYSLTYGICGFLFADATGKRGYDHW